MTKTTSIKASEETALRLKLLANKKNLPMNSAIEMLLDENERAKGGPAQNDLAEIRSLLLENNRLLMVILKHVKEML